jgi:hypothetical protein
MKNSLIWLGLGILMGIFMHSLWIKDQPETWKPVLEKTDFNYLDYSVENVIKEINRIRDEIRGQKSADPDGPLSRTMSLLMQLEYYYLPITEARQLIYDADRLVSLHRTDDARAKLIQAQNRLARVEKTKKNHAIKKSIAKLDALIKKAVLEIDGPYRESTARLEAAGAEANLMLLKGELVLSGT